MDNGMRDMANRSGIYVIVNIMDCKAYVGQARNFSKRSHIAELAQGTDNDRLQKAYDDQEKDREFVYFIATSDKAGGIAGKNILNKYERLYMTLMEEMGFCLYNRNIRKCDRTLEKLGLDEEEHDRAEEALTKDFEIRFGHSPKSLKEAGEETKQQALDHYVSQRLTQQEKTGKRLEGDRLLFNRARIKEILGGQEKSITALDLGEMFISKAGSYIGEGIDQILYYETEETRKFGYCLWTFANNAVPLETVRECCRQRGAQGKDTYVLFSFTPSAEYGSKPANKHAVLKKVEAGKLMPEELDFLHLNQGEKGQYIVPDGIDCTASGQSSSNAFVIQEFFLATEVVSESGLKEMYTTVGARGTLYDVDKGGYQRSTKYVQLKDTQNSVDYEKLCTEAKHRSFCFVGKLVAPYVVRLTQE